MAKEIKDENIMAFVISGILVFSDKIIGDELSRKTKEWITMTKVGRLYAEEARQMAQIADAKRMVSVMNSILSKGYTVEDACELAGFTPDEYEKSKSLIESMTVVA